MAYFWGHMYILYLVPHLHTALCALFIASVWYLSTLQKLFWFLSKLKCTEVETKIITLQSTEGVCHQNYTKSDMETDLDDSSGRCGSNDDRVYIHYRVHQWRHFRVCKYLQRRRRQWDIPGKRTIVTHRRTAEIFCHCHLTHKSYSIQFLLPVSLHL